jgi:branched-chain amino acid transport system permease protein
VERILIQAINGVTFAGLLFLVSSGFTLIFGIMKVVNMAHGMFYVLGAYIGLTLQRQTGNWVFAIIGGSIAVGIMAFIVEKIVFFVKSDLSQAVLTLGFAVTIKDILLLIYGGLPSTIRQPELLRTSVSIFNLTYPAYRLFVLGLSMVLGFLIWFLIKRTQLGRIIRAGTDNRKMVASLGINIDRVFTLVFVLAGLVTGISGAVGGSYMAFGPGTDFIILTYALVVVIMGGLGSVPGSALGALIVGLVDSFGRTNFPEFVNFLLMGSLVIVLLFRPYGLLGRKEV